PPVLDVRGAKRAGEGFTCELRVASRAGEAADVHKQLDVECVQYVDELCARPRRVADGPDGWRITSVGSGRGRLRVPRVIGTHQRGACGNALRAPPPRTRAPRVPRG